VNQVNEALCVSFVKWMQTGTLPCSAVSHANPQREMSHEFFSYIELLKSNLSSLPNYLFTSSIIQNSSSPLWYLIAGPTANSI